MVGGA